VSKHHVSTTINGEPTEFLWEPQLTLLDVLRDELHLTGSKEGCSSGDCGACSVTLDGGLVCSCLMLAVEAEGHAIEEIEGANPRHANDDAADEWRAKRGNAPVCAAIVPSFDNGQRVFTKK